MMPEFQVLNYLEKQGPTNTFRLARDLGVDREHLFDFINKLEAKGALTVKSGVVRFLEYPHEEKEMRKEETREKYLYVYGIINDGGFTLEMKGLRNMPIQRIDYKDISALISFYPFLHPVIEEREALCHAEILAKLAAKTTIIPMAFGTVFKEQQMLETILARSYPAIKKTLELVKDKIELGVKVVKKETEDIAEEVKVPFLFREDIEDVAGETNQKILEELNKLSVKSLMGDNFSDRLLLNHSFLVDKNKFSQFSSKIAELEEKYPNLKFIYTGPWPAYSFVNINIRVS